MISNFALCLLLAGAVAEPRLVELAAGSSFEFLADGPSVDVLVPVVPGADLAQGEELRAPVVRDVALGSRHLDSFRQKLTPSWVLDRQGRPTDLRLAVDLGAFVEPGSYDVTLELGRAPRLPAPPGSSTAAEGPRVQRLKLQLVHPTAALVPPPALVLERVVPSPVPLFDGPAGLPALLLEESSRRSHVTRLRLRDDRKERGAGLALTSPGSIPAGEARPVAYAFDGDFPIGSVASGTIVALAPQLSAPVGVPYTIHTRLSKAFIPPAIVLGLVLGFLLRTRLRSRIETAGARLESLRFRAKLERERRLHPDRILRKTLEGLEDGLKGAEERRDVAAMKKALEEAEAGVQRALKELAGRREELKPKVESLLATLERAWVLPAPVGEGLERLRSRGQALRTLLEQDDVAGAAGLEAELSGALVRELRERIGAWRGGMRDGLTRLVAWRQRAPRSLAPGLDEAASALQRLREQPEAALDATALAMLENVHSGWALLRELFGSLRRRLLLDIVGTVVGALAPGPERKSVEALEQQRDALLQRWRDEALGTPERLATVVPEAEALVAAMATAIRANCSDESRGETDALLQQGRFEDAARRAVEKLGPAPGPGFTSFALPVELERKGIQPTAAPEAPRIQLRLSSAPAGDLTVEQQLARTWGELLRDKALQWVLSSLLILVAGYLVFAETFVGTASNFAAIFFWAFGLDVGVDAITSLAGRFKPPGG